MLQERFQTCPHLPSLPAVALQVLELAEKPQVHLDEIAQVISRDAALSARILRVANSSFFGHSHKVGTLTHAVVILGLKTVTPLALGFSLADGLRQHGTRGLDAARFWRRSLYASAAAHTLSTRFRVGQPEQCFLAGLLMDAGMLLFDRVLGDEYADLLLRASSHAHLPDLERIALGNTHAQASEYLARHWKLPEALVLPMALHHEPRRIAEGSLRDACRVAVLASRCADAFIDDDPHEAIAEARSLCREHWGCNEQDCDGLLRQIQARTRVLAPLLDINLDEQQIAATREKANALRLAAHARRRSA